MLDRSSVYGAGDLQTCQNFVPRYDALFVNLIFRSKDGRRPGGDDRAVRMQSAVQHSVSSCFQGLHLLSQPVLRLPFTLHRRLHHQ